MKKLGFMVPLLALAACASTPPQTFMPLNYSYLPPILLKVSQINVSNVYVPTSSQVEMAAQDPAPPAETLMAMLNQRLQPAGQPGTGTVTVQSAYVDEVSGNLVGQMSVEVNLASADGRSTGFTEATVTATQTAPDADDSSDMRTALYGLTKQLMTQMNVQLQYAIQKHLPQWISWTNNGAIAAPAGASSPGVGVQSTSLAAPPGVATVSNVAVQPASASNTTSTAASAPAQPAVGQGSGNVSGGTPNYLPGAGPTALTAGQN